MGKRIPPKERLEELHTTLRLAKHVDYQGRFMTKVRKCIELYFDACAFPNGYELSPLEREMLLYAYRKRPSLPVETLDYVVSKLALLKGDDNDK